MHQWSFSRPGDEGLGRDDRFGPGAEFADAVGGEGLKRGPAGIRDGDSGAHGASSPDETEEWLDEIAAKADVAPTIHDTSSSMAPCSESKPRASVTISTSLRRG